MNNSFAGWERIQISLTIEIILKIDPHLIIFVHSINSVWKREKEREREREREREKEKETDVSGSARVTIIIRNDRWDANWCQLGVSERGVRTRWANSKETRPMII